MPNAIAQVPCRIDSTFDATLRNPSLSIQNNVTKHFCAGGVFLGRGPDNPSGGWEIIIPEGQKRVIDLPGKSKRGGFVVDFELGGERLQVLGGVTSSEEMRVDNQAGNVSIAYRIEFTEIKRR
jgi:hypothetical protein